MYLTREYKNNKNDYFTRDLSYQKINSIIATLEEKLLSISTLISTLENNDESNVETSNIVQQLEDLLEAYQQEIKDLELQKDILVK